ncbi:VOC family protein [Tenggerimyces flavus]|uniref:VOC family protein n=1 Tax=Tenggerimyces flavus TaxID=1708749 RepID=A0ABV7Y528_9ACTN|nr:VOC family protein [Tenggerimyces flavus]MBM7790587.1 hypothetical protein [Tenggerimyces flavus]
MHRSRVYAVLIDTPREQVAGATDFWSAALGVQARPLPDEPQFISLPGATDGVRLALQAVDDAPRYHVDIESDDPEAELERLVALGAELVQRWQECRILRAPGGHLLCVLPVESDQALFDATAKTWA